MTFNDKIQRLINAIDNKDLIGIELMNYYDDDNFINELYSLANSQISDYLDSYNCSEPKIIIIALSLIAMKHYNGNFWDKVYDILLKDEYCISETVFSSKLRNLIKTHSPFYEINNRIIDFPLIMSIVPYNYIDKYIEFCFDIYKYNFEYSLKGFKIEDLYDVFFSLKNKMVSDNNILEVTGLNKSYTLIQSTKTIVLKHYGINSLVKLTEKIIRLIDNFYWDKEVNIHSSYLKTPFINWKNKISKDERKKRTDEAKKKTEFIKWIPKFVLHNDKVYLETRNDKISDIYERTLLRIDIFENDNLIHSKNNLIARPIIGGCRLEIESFSINNPLNKIRYKLMCGSDIIYDSEDKLYRDYILFDSNNNEFKSNTNHYDEPISIICKKNQKMENYLSSVNVHSYNIYRYLPSKDTKFYIGNELITFAKIIQDGIYGIKAKNVYFDNDEENIIYNSIANIVFSSKDSPEDISIKINGTNHKLMDLDYVSFVTDNNINYFKIDLSSYDSYYYNIKIKNYKTNKTIVKYSFILDKYFNFEIKKLEENYVFVINSDLFGNIERKFTLSSSRILNIGFSLEEISHTLNLIFYHPIYCINSKWYTLDRYIWKDELNNQSQLYLSGININNIKVYDEKNRLVINSLYFKKESNRYSIGINSLIYKSANQYFINIEDENGEKYIIRLLNEIIYDETKLSYKNNILEILPLFQGKDELTISLEVNNNVKYTKDFSTAKPIKLKIQDTNVNYKLKIFKQGFFDDDKVFDEKFLCLNNKLNIGDKLKINKISYTKRIKKDSNLENTEVQKAKNTWIEIKEKLKENEYNIFIYQYDQQKKYYEYDELKIELTSPVSIEGKGTAVLTSEGDLLYYDRTKKTIAFEEKGYYPIIDEIEFVIRRDKDE